MPVVNFFDWEGSVPPDHTTTSTLPSGNDGRKDDGSKVHGSPGIKASKGTTHILITEFLISPGIRTAAPIGPLVTAAGKFSNEAAKNAAEMVDVTVDAIQQLNIPTITTSNPVPTNGITVKSVPLPGYAPTTFTYDPNKTQQTMLEITKKDGKVIKEDTLDGPIVTGN